MESLNVKVRVKIGMKMAIDRSLTALQQFIFRVNELPTMMYSLSYFQLLFGLKLIIICAKNGAEDFSPTVHELMFL